MRASSLALAGLVPSAFGANLLVSHFSGSVYSLSYKEGSGNGNNALSIKSSVQGCGKMPTWLTLDSANGTLYCFDEESTGSGVVSSYAVANDGSLELSGQAQTVGKDVHGWLYGGEDGKGFVSLAEYDLGTISTYKLPLTASSKRLQKVQFTMSGSGPVPSRQNGPHPHSSTTDPTGKFLLVPDLGADLIRIFSINANSGELTTCPAAKAGAGDGPRHATWWAPKAGSTNGQMLYTVNELGNSVSAWQVTYPAAAGGCLSLNRTQTLSTFPAGAKIPSGNLPAKAAEVHVSGNFLYAANRNDQTFGSQQDSIATYTIGPKGAISFVELTNAHGWYVRTFALNKAGTMLAVGGQTSSNVAILARNATSGKLGGLLASVNVASPGMNGGEDGLSSVIWDE